ncbi:Protein of unknown function [Pyronema omphalodes CBS 100304]|uniref:Uncharacterized protein n=1 Tax=Pyronema omphalodes (strain CBS 100304) TaxID=1076935 RepID=U4KYT1_PYROM|nr:Protein of unknown function [Pyronema omphalodes CBS 100304]
MVKIPPARRNPGLKARKDTREPELAVTKSEEDGILPAFYQPCHESDEDISEDSEHNMEDADQGLNLDQYTPSVYSDYDPMDEVTMLPGRVHFVREREAFRVKTAWKTCRIAKRVWRKLIKKAEEGGRTDERGDVFWIGQKIETWEERINRLADERWQAEFWWRWGYVDDVVQA